MATLTVASTSRTGVAPTLVAAASGGDEIPNDGRTWVHVRNGHATNPRTVTFVTPQTVVALAVADQAVVIPAVSERLIGPFPTATFNNASGRVAVTYSDSAADVTLGAFKMGA